MDGSRCWKQTMPLSYAQVTGLSSPKALARRTTRAWNPRLGQFSKSTIPSPSIERST